MSLLDGMNQKDKRVLAAIVLLTLFVPLIVFTAARSGKDVSSIDGADSEVETDAGAVEGVEVDSEEVYNARDMENKVNKYSKVPDIMSASELSNKKSVITTSKGIIEIELFGDEAPLTVSNHIFLTNDDFYNGLTFHRREEGFVIQGGDPAGNGTGGPGYTFEDEPVLREYEKGVVAMANAGPDTNGSQFFIMLEDYPLPPSYTIFGKVISGIDVVESIQVGDVMTSVEIKNL